MADKYRRFARSGSSRCGTATAAWVGAVVSASLPQAAREKMLAAAKVMHNACFTSLLFMLQRPFSFFQNIPYGRRKGKQQRITFPYYRII